MTQYSEKVRKQKEWLAAEAWGNQIKYIHAQDGIFEVAYNNGERHFEDRKTGKKWIEGYRPSKATLVDRFNNWLADVEVGRDPNGL